MYNRVINQLYDISSSFVMAQYPNIDHKYTTACSYAGKLNRKMRSLLQIILEHNTKYLMPETLQ